MTQRRPPGFDLAAVVGEPSFTPRAADLDDLIALLARADDDLAETIERTLVRIPDAAEARAMGYASTAPPLRGRLVRLLARLAGPGTDGDSRRRRILPILATACRDGDDKTARNAIIALGKLGGEGAEDALLARLALPTTAPLRRSLAESLGKIGGARARAALEPLRDPDDPELARIVDRARVRLDRDRARSAGGAIDPARAPAHPTPILATCRAGLESFVADDLGGRMARPGAVTASLDGPYAGLFAARTFLRAGFPLDEGTELATILTSPAALAIFRRFTDGPIRYRLAFLQGGHRRAEVLRVAALVRAREPALVNDPKASLWEAEIRERADRFLVTLFPRVDDPRFAYRLRDVPGASHPTIAAALVRAAGILATDVVWDPFCGSGTELVERARAGPAAALFGSDLDPDALAAAAENLGAAGVTARLFLGDARAAAPAGTTLILTNPPMGRRVLDPAALAPLLSAVVAQAARSLPPGGRLAWISPIADATHESARAAGLHTRLRRRVDMGGFSAEMQVFTNA